MTTLPSELQQFASYLDAQPSNVQAAFRYCLSLMMVESGKAKLIKTTPSDDGAICTFETIAGDVFSVTKPEVSPEQEALLIEHLRMILDE